MYNGGVILLRLDWSRVIAMCSMGPTNVFIMKAHTTSPQACRMNEIIHSGSFCRMHRGPCTVTLPGGTTKVSTNEDTTRGRPSLVRNARFRGRGKRADDGSRSKRWFNKFVELLESVSLIHGDKLPIALKRREPLCFFCFPF